MGRRSSPKHGEARALHLRERPVLRARPRAPQRRSAITSIGPSEPQGLALRASAIMAERTASMSNAGSANGT